jgi:hypothetical protein
MCRITGVKQNRETLLPSVPAVILALDQRSLAGETACPTESGCALSAPGNVETPEPPADSLAFRHFDAPPAEEAGINGPGARSDHRQNGAEDRLWDGNARIAGMEEIPREGDPDLYDGCQPSRHRGPQADYKKYAGADSDDLQEEHGQRRRRSHAGDPKMDERYARKQPQKQKSDAGPTVSEVRK